MRHLFLPLILSLTACSGNGSGDDDGDGLSNADEALYTTDPLNADTDGDGLSDLEDINAGTDPLNPDTDGDRYLDGWEVIEGSDPLDGTSWIYQGHWPYNPDKATFPGQPIDQPAQLGLGVANFNLGTDQFGDIVSLHDFIGKPIVIDISSMWCGPCHDYGYWLAGEDLSYDSYNPGVREAVNNGDIVWITVLMDDYSQGNEADAADVATWAAQFENHNIPVLTDPGRAFSYYHLPYPGPPAFHYVNPAGVLEYTNPTNSQYQDTTPLDMAMAAAGL